MEIKEIHEKTAEKYAEAKEIWLQGVAAEHDQPTKVTAFRNGAAVVQAVLYPDRDKMLQVAHQTAFATSCDVLCLSFEAYYSPLPENPMTNEPWGASELSFMAENYPESIEQGWVAETMSTHTLDREGHWYFTSQTFQVKEGELELGEVVTISSEDADKHDGVIPDFLEQVMTQENSVHHHAEEDPVARFLRANLTQEAADAHSDVALIRFLTENKLVLACTVVADKDGERKEIVETRLQAIAEETGAAVKVVEGKGAEDV